MRIQKNITYLDHKSIYNLLQRGLVASTHSGKKEKKETNISRSFDLSNWTRSNRSRYK